MGLISPVLPQLGQPNASEDADIVNAFTMILNEINGNLDAANIENGSLTAEELVLALAQQLGVSSGGVARRGYAEVLTEQSTASAALTDLATVGPSVTVNVPANGLVAVFAAASLRSSTLSQRAQVGILEDGAPLTAPESLLLGWPGTSAVTKYTSPEPGGGASAEPGTEDRGGAGWVVFPAAAGARTYKLAYKTTGGGATATFANRKLWVVTFGF